MPVISADQGYKIPDTLNKYIFENTLVVRSPGRINLIGEHTDYNNGYVLPAAIDKAAYLAVTPRRDNEIHLFSIDLKAHYSTDTEIIQKSLSASWPNYLLGTVQQFKLAGVNLKGFDAALTADIPIGAGLSSSAAVECAMALALNELYQTNFDKLTLVKMAQKAEHDFAGVQCGIMDQFASMFGKRNHVIKLDCLSLEYEYEPFNMDGIKILLLDTGVKHSLASSEYNLRRIQCETGVALIHQHIPAIKSLRDVTIEMLDQYVLNDDLIVYHRCKYVVEENQRLLQGCKDLENGNLAAFGSKMFQTHYGLRRLYQVSCPELDFLVAQVKDYTSVLGARMMGGGFGGCTINLVKEEAVEDLVEQTTKAYRHVMQRDLKAYVAKIEAGGNILR